MKVKKWLLAIAAFAVMAMVCAVAAGAENEHTGYIVYAGNEWSPFILDGSGYSENGYDCTFVTKWTPGNCEVSSSGTYTVSISDIMQTSFDDGIDNGKLVPVSGEGASLFTVKIDNLSNDYGFGRDCEGYERMKTSQQRMDFAKEKGADVTDVKITQVKDGKLTTVPIDISKIYFGDLECNGKFEIEIYDTYGDTNYDPPIDVDKIDFNESLSVQFTIVLPEKVRKPKYEYLALSDTTAQITKYNGDETDVNVPDEIDGRKVLSIGDFVFSHHAEINRVTIPDGVLVIGPSAFEYCENLKSVTIPHGLTDVLEYAFYGCTELKSVIIPYSVTNISDYALGYYSDNGQLNKVDSFKIYCYSGTAGERYAKDNGFDYELISCTNHQFSGWNITKAATCTATGTKARTCTICGKTEIATIAKSVHKYVNTVVKPTYTAQGYTLHKCSVCGANYKDTYTAKLKLSKVSGLKVASKTNKGISLQWKRNTAADGYVLEKYDGKKWVTVKKISGNANVKYTISGLKSSTTYKFRIKAYKSSVSSNFSYLNVNTRPYKTTGMKCTGKTNNSITIKWNKNTSAGGYVLERYNGKKWITVKAFTSNTNTRFTVSKLSAGKTHKFRLRAYKTFGKIKEYSEYTYLNANTKPNAMTGFGIKSIASNAVTLKWNKNSSASGYCVEKWNGKKWVQVKKLTSNATVTYKINRLKKNTVYKFRVRAYKTFGKTSEYSAYTGVATARTKK